MYKIIEKCKNINGFSKTVYVVLNDDNEELCKFTTRENAEKFISVWKNELEKEGLHGTS